MQTVSGHRDSGDADNNNEDTLHLCPGLGAPWPGAARTLQARFTPAPWGAKAAIPQTLCNAETCDSNDTQSFLCAECFYLLTYLTPWQPCERGTVTISAAPMRKLRPKAHSQEVAERGLEPKLWALVSVSRPLCQPVPLELRFLSPGVSTASQTYQGMVSTRRTAFRKAIGVITVSCRGVCCLRPALGLPRSVALAPGGPVSITFWVLRES